MKLKLQILNRLIFQAPMVTILITYTCIKSIYLNNFYTVMLITIIIILNILSMQIENLEEKIKGLKKSDEKFR